MEILTRIRRTAYHTAFAFALAVAAPPVIEAAAAQATVLETTIKATYLYKFEGYVDWPKGTFASPESPVTLCIVGSDPFGEVLDQALSKQIAGGRLVTARRLASVSGNTGCNVMYIAGSDTQSVEQALGVVRGTPVLTITDSASGSSETGVINFVVEDNRVRFQIDPAAASQNGLTISSDLLKLAVSAKPRS